MDQIRILLADDDSDHQRLLVRSLAERRRPVQVTLTSGREELLEAARKDRFDCIVIDYNLPPHTAPEIIREVTPLQDGVPWIVISSSHEQKVVVESLRNGVADFVPKLQAIDGRTLWRRIEEVVAKSRTQRKEQRTTNRRMRALRKLADTDPLTGLYNRRFTERHLRNAEKRTDRRREASLILVDLDHFKKINDTLGHDAGDQVLRDAANVMRALASPADIISRWGGEEFLIIRQSAPLTDAWIWADNFRRELARRVHAGDTGEGITASVGVATIPTAELSESAVMLADQAMYLAKESGRNRVCTWPMVVAIDTANQLQTNPSMSARERLLACVECLREELGATQLDHIGEHGRAVADLTMFVVSQFPGEFQNTEELRLAAEFHDVGKLGIPEELLALPRLLTDGERRFIDEHARFGAELLEACGAPKCVAQAVREHHVRFDAVKRPVAQEVESPTFAAVVSACDAFITMMSKRPYAEPRTPAQALAEMRQMRGSQFHPDVVDVLQFGNYTNLKAA